MIKSENHPDYSLHRSIQHTSLRCGEIISLWRASNKMVQVPVYDLEWSAEKAETFFKQLSAMLVVYNQILWEGFQYCQLCKGKCCTDGVIEASEVYDFLALALLDEKLPELPEVIHTTDKTCIYLDGPRCAWPQTWRLYKCWSYYCLGPASVWEKMQDGKSLNQRYEEIHQALKPAINLNLPEALRVYEKRHRLSFAESASSPTALARYLQIAINKVFVVPLAQEYPELWDLMKPYELVETDSEYLPLN